MPLVSFAGGDRGTWQVQRITAVIGAPLPVATRLEVSETPEASERDAEWVLRGVTSNARYTTRDEHAALAAIQPPLGRPDATCAALIPITKSAAWWQLAQDERRHLLEERSHHITTGLEQLPAVARRLHHGRDLGEPFDFLTWFEYAPEHADGFERLVDRLRATPEWQFVEREIDVRLTR